MYQDKKVLLIGGGGTLGTHVSTELLRLGCTVDVICLEDKVSENDRLSFYKGHVTREMLSNMFEKKHYEAIVNFIDYPNVEEYKQIHSFLSAHTDQLVFLSSYRVYADLEHPVTENAPLLLDVIEDKDFLENEKYAVSKARCERYIKESGTDNWTIVRPVISFSHIRFDLIMHCWHKIIDDTKAGKTILLPSESRNLTAGLDWSGNSGKAIAHLLFKKDALKEIFTISSAQNLTWGEVAEIYTELLGAEFRWVDTDTYIQLDPDAKHDLWRLYYDRLYDRNIDNSKLLRVTGLKKEDFTSIHEGIKIELSRIR